MSKQAVNPYLPLTEYVPDGEPYVFGNRVYIFGSHDLAGGKAYCEGDYVSYSASVKELGEWQYHGTSYRKSDDASNKEMLEMWAPDVAQGADGRYYMYYCYAFGPHISVCVSDQPEGPYTFLGNVKYPETILGGKDLEEYSPFDPAIIRDDDGKIYLYYGFGAEEQIKLPSKEELLAAGVPEGEELDAMLASYANAKFSPGAMCVELEEDMLTAKAEPHMVAPSSKYAYGTTFEGHAFYEASSIRKMNGKYYFIYSSQLSHELCYAVSDHPNYGYVYGGTLISNGDIGYKGNTQAKNTLGNNHGSMVEIDRNWYVFYHRQTNGTESSRQGCAEKLEILEDGRILQAEMTSCGLNNGPLTGEGVYPASICCNLISRGTMDRIAYSQMDHTNLTIITQEAEADTPYQFLQNINDGTLIGYKYFALNNMTEIRIRLRGDAEGVLTVSTDFEGSHVIGTKKMTIHSDAWEWITLPTEQISGTYSLYFTYRGEGKFDVREFELCR